ncbi:PREDICTED: uncharacterized protein LOC104591401 isoform X2 [Nelumbo nucifera]|nr:PREDICTED: uncharacterized protein LOC104591401 isoform X2 [Nelumbo nucifera]
MVESFVDEFRASNAGKFPTPSVARKHLGGSYYVIRQILQELEYRSKLPPISKKVETLLEKEEVVKHETQIKVEDKLSCEATMSCTSCEPDLRIEENNHMTIIDNKEVDEAASQHFKAKEDLRIEENNHMTAIGNKEMDEAASQHFKAKEGPKVSPWIENALSKESEGPTPTVSHSSVGTPSIQRKLESKDVLYPYPEKLENSEQKEATHENLLDSNGQKGDIMKEAGKETHESDRFERDIAKENKEEPSQKRSTVWGSLKSFADGIINLWRKM